MKFMQFSPYQKFDRILPSHIWDAMHERVGGFHIIHFHCSMIVNASLCIQLAFLCVI